MLLPQRALPPGYPGDRNASTSILFLLPTGARSRLHRVRSEEIWLHHRGDDLRLSLGAAGASRTASRTSLRLGQGANALFQAVVPAEAWQEAEALPGKHGYALVGCVVAPGFDFEDFELDTLDGSEATSEPR
jgi:predicted cupin superfamily sugar epimerase